MSVYCLIHYVCRCIYICVYIGLEAVSPLFWAAVLAFSAGTELYATKIQKRCERAFMYMNACVCVRACRSVFGACGHACVRVLCVRVNVRIPDMCTHTTRLYIRSCM